MTREQLIEAIDLITAKMKGPMSNLERALFHYDRKVLREKLADTDAAEVLKGHRR